MKNLCLILIGPIIMCMTNVGFSQQTTYDVTPGAGNGLRFWSNDNYKIHMGNDSLLYHYGTVNGFSIKMNMNSSSGWGWTWGNVGQSPIAALDNTGTFQLAGKLGIGVPNPTHKLDVNGSMKLKNGNTDLLIYRDSDVGDWTLLRANIGNGIGLIGAPDVVALSVSRISSNVGIGTTAPNAKLHVRNTAIAQSSTATKDANLIIEGTSTTRSTTEGAALGFVVPANTDGSNQWQQGRILVTPDNTNNSNASGRMYLQTRFYNGTWTWRNNLVLLSSGNIGVGTSSPSTKLHVVTGPVGNTTGSSISGVKWEIGRQKLTLKAYRTDNQTEWKNTTLKLEASIDSTPHQSIDFVNDGDYKEHIDIYTNNQIFNSRFTAQGDLGIGTTNTHGYKLAVAGKIITEEVNVQLESAWPDYVFSPSYDLLSLEEVKQHIQDKGYLPNMPSEQEVLENGIELGAMNAKLLEKIEELTLYMIEMKEENKELKSRIEELEME